MWLKLWEMGFIWQISLCKLFLPEKSWFWSLPLSASCSLWSEGPFPQHEAALMTSTRSQADTGEAPGTVSWINFPPANCSLGYFWYCYANPPLQGHQQHFIGTLTSCHGKNVAKEARSWQRATQQGGCGHSTGSEMFKQRGVAFGCRLTSKTW